MPKRSPKLTNARKEEIIAACEAIYKKKSFKDITINDIANYTSLTRTSIYNYFETKEEIFLALLTKEYWLWVDELNKIILNNDTLSAEVFSGKLAHSLENRKQLLKILSMNHYDMEENSREENLIEMKEAYGSTLKTVDACLIKFFPKMTERDRTDFLYSFFPFMFGIYPYTVVTEKQRSAMQKANIDYKYMSVFEMIYRFVMGQLAK